MNAGATSERVYEALKGRILGLAHRPGERLDPARLGDELHSSVTPVRDALHILTGECLVEARPGDGFHVRPIDAPALQDLYEWNAQVLMLALRPAPRPGWETVPILDVEAADTPLDSALFTHIARNSPNAEHHRAVASLNDRLHAARLAETRIVTEREAELGQLRNFLASGEMAALRRSLVAYHRRRARVSAAIVRALYRQI